MTVAVVAGLPLLGLLPGGAKSWVLWSESNEVPGERAVLDSKQAVHIREDEHIFPEALQSQEPELHVERKEKKTEISFESQGWKL